MTISDVYALRRQGRVVEAYETARRIYAEDKGPAASTIMYLTAVDMQQKLKDEGQTDAADKISKALERLLAETPEHLLLGCWGEEVSAECLSDKGYVILERDWHSSHRDIDIIARQGDSIVFVEVKTRRNRDYTEPLQAVNYQKRKNLSRAVNHYLHYRSLDCPWRFDVITVVGHIGCDTPEINHVEDFPLL